MPILDHIFIVRKLSDIFEREPYNTLGPETTKAESSEFWGIVPWWLAPSCGRTEHAQNTNINSNLRSPIFQVTPLFMVLPAANTPKHGASAADGYANGVAYKLQPMMRVLLALFS